jgi:hypothetical protein
MEGRLGVWRSLPFLFIGSATLYEFLLLDATTKSKGNSFGSIFWYLILNYSPHGFEESPHKHPFSSVAVDRSACSYSKNIHS